MGDQSLSLYRGAPGWLPTLPGTRTPGHLQVGSLCWWLWLVCILELPFLRPAFHGSESHLWLLARTGKVPTLSRQSSASPKLYTDLISPGPGHSPQSLPPHSGLLALGGAICPYAFVPKVFSHRSFFLSFIYLFLDSGEGRQKERERNSNVWLPLTCPLLGSWPAAQACALDWESNQWPFGLQASAQSTEPHQPGLTWDSQDSYVCQPPLAPPPFRSSGYWGPAPTYDALAKGEITDSLLITFLRIPSIIRAFSTLDA